MNRLILVAILVVVAVSAENQEDTNSVHVGHKTHFDSLIQTLSKSERPFRQAFQRLGIMFNKAVGRIHHTDEKGSIDKSGSVHDILPTEAITLEASESPDHISVMTAGSADPPTIDNHNSKSTVGQQKKEHAMRYLYDMHPKRENYDTFNLLHAVMGLLVIAAICLSFVISVTVYYRRMKGDNQRVWRFGGVYVPLKKDNQEQIEIQNYLDGAFDESLDEVVVHKL